MTRKFNELVERGAVQSSSSTGLLLGLAPAHTADVEVSNGVQQENAAANEPVAARTSAPDTATSADTSSTDTSSTGTSSTGTGSSGGGAAVVGDSAHSGENADSAPAPGSRNADTHEGTPTKAAKEPARRSDSTGGGGQDMLAAGLDAVLELLPAADDRLITGPRRDIKVRDLTYDITSPLYFSFTRLKTDLSRAAKRKVTNPDLMDVALVMLGEDATAVLAQLETYSSEVFDTQSTRRRLTVRVAEERHRHLVDTALDIEEMVGRRVPVTDLWSLAVALLIDRAGRLRSP